MPKHSSALRALMSVCLLVCALEPRGALMDLFNPLTNVF
jgi:hypothetical protein